MNDLILKHHEEFLKDFYFDLLDSDDYDMPSDYIEKNRYLNKDLTPIPGYYRFENTPYWQEPLNMMGPQSNVQKIIIVKGVQIGFTTGVLENTIAYNIGCNPCPQLYITADHELAKMSFEVKIERLIDSCELRELIYSQTGNKSKKTGDTSLSKSYVGGYLYGIGAGSPGKLRSMSFPVILMDELDAYKDKLAKEGDPVSLADNRSNAYGDSRKILYGSTPLVLQSSKIWALYLKGDQRKYFVPCKYCNKKQELIWHGVNESGKIFGIVFDIIDGLPDYNSVGYKCQHCGKIMKNHDKALILNQGEWIATAKCKEPGLISYQISALYSPPGMFSFEKIVGKWADCWDLEKNRLKDKEKYREFRNLMQGLPFKETGESIKMEKVREKRSYHYLKDQINNVKFKQDSESEILLLTGAVDVQKNNLFVDVKGWCKGGRSYTLNFFSIDGPTEDFNSPVWTMLDDVLTQRIWADEEGRQYRIINTVIDSGSGLAQYVYNFCKSYSGGVYAIKGQDTIKGGLTYKEFTKDTLARAGLPIAYHVNTTKLKDRIAKIFNFQWDDGKFQPDWYANFPQDMHDNYFRMFEAENKVDEYDKKTNKFIRTSWRLVPGRENHAFDTFAYNLACLEMVADYACRNQLGLDYLSWEKFWEYSANGIFYVK